MKMAVVGAGIVGLTTGAGFAELGHTVTCADIDADKITGLQRGIVPYHEPELLDLVERNRVKGRLHFCVGAAGLPLDADLVFIAVGTPSDEQGDLWMAPFWSAADELEAWLTRSGGAKVVAIKSTVPVGTADRLEEILNRSRSRDARVQVASVPEFMREGRAVRDFLEPARVVIGTSCEETGSRLTGLHAGLECPIVITGRRSAELAKLAANAFLSIKISFSNEVAALAEQADADYADVARVLGTDPRIGPHFLGAGLGFGGSCLPKDTRALVRFAEHSGAPQTLADAALHVNLTQPLHVVRKLEMALPDLGQCKVALLGLAFKPGTDDMREAPSLRLASELLLRHPGIALSAYDPAANRAARHVLDPRVRICNSAEEALRGADAAVVVTEWPEFREIGADDFKSWMNRPIIWDGRNALDAAELNAQGVVCIGTGRLPGYNRESIWPAPQLAPHS